jgi:hypothetical protein
MSRTALDRRRQAEVRRVREIGCRKARERVTNPDGRKRLSLDLAVRSLAVGTDQVRASLRSGSRDTVHTRIGEAFGQPVGRLPFRRVGGLRVRGGANLYDLRTAAATSPHARRELRRLIYHARISGAPHSAGRKFQKSTQSLEPSPSCLSPIRVERRVAGALRWALKRVKVDGLSRENVGYRLAWTLRHIGLDAYEVERAMEPYWQEVRRLRSPEYGWSDVVGSVRRVFRRSIVIDEDFDQWAQDDDRAFFVVDTTWVERTDQDWRLAFAYAAGAPC